MWMRGFQWALCSAVFVAAVVTGQLPAQQLPAVRDDMGQSAAAAPPSIVLDILVDHSSSTDPKKTGESDASIPAVITLVEKASVSRTPVQVRVTLFNGDLGVLVLGDERTGMPTSAFASIIQRLNSLPQPSGLSPLDRALESVLKMPADLPKGTKHIVVNIGDGDSTDTFPREDLIHERLAEEIAEVEASELSPAIQEGKIKGIMLGTSVVGKKLMLEQDDAQHFKCLENARKLQQAGVTFFTLQVGSRAEMKEIHAEAGGARDNLIEVSGRDRLVETILELKLGLVGVLSPPIKDYPADPTINEDAYPIAADEITTGGIAIWILDEAQADFFEHWTAVGRAGDAEYVFTAANEDPNAVTLKDKARAVKVLLLKLDAYPDGGEVVLELSSSSKTMPAIRTAGCFRLNEDLELVAKPSGTTAEDREPILVSPGNKRSWEAGLRNRSTDELVPLTSLRLSFQPLLQTPEIDAQVMKGQPHNDLERGQFVWFESAERFALHEGRYLIRAEFITASGLIHTLDLEREVICQVRPIQVLLHPRPAEGQLLTPMKEGVLQLPEIGDRVPSLMLPWEVRGIGNDLPLDIVLEIVEQPVDQLVIAFHGSKISLAPAGASNTSARTKLSIQPSPRPGSFSKDGPYEIVLRAYRVDTRQELAIVVAQGSEIVPMEPIRFQFRQPKVICEPKWPFKAQEGAAAGPSEVHVYTDVTTPHIRRIGFNFWTTSDIPRIIDVPETVTVADADSKGRYLSDITFKRAAGTPAQIKLSPREQVTITYELEYPASPTALNVLTTLRVAGAGLVPCEVLILGHVRTPSIRSWIEAYRFPASFMMLSVMVVPWVVYCRLCKKKEGEEVTLNDRPRDGAWLSRQHNAIVLNLEDDHSFDYGTDGDNYRNTPRQLTLPSLRTGQRFYLRRYADREAKELSFEISFDEIGVSEDGRPFATGQYQGETEFEGRAKWWAGVLVVLCVTGGISFLLAFNINHPTVIAIVQGLWDLGRCLGQWRWLT